MRKYPVKDAINAWDHVFVKDRLSGGIVTISLSNLLKNQTEPEAALVGETQGTVTSVGLSAPVGFNAAGGPVTAAGTLALTYAAGYSIPQNSNQANWSIAFGWGNHAAAGYLSSSSIGVTVQPFNASTVVDGGYVHTDNNFTAAQVAKLAAIVPGATANSEDATLIARANHTGTQPAATISDFSSAVSGNAAVSANTAKQTNATHTGDVTGSTALTLATVNSNVGAFGSASSVPTFAVNAKGLITGAGSAAIQIAQSQVTGLVADLAAKAPIGGGGSDPWVYTYLALNSTVSTVAYVAVAGMSFTALANTKYLIEVVGAYQTAATTTGIGLSLDIPSGTIIGINQVATSATALGGTEQIADATTTGATTGVRAINTNTPIIGKWVVSVGATPGVVQLMQRSEIAASNTVLQAGLTIMGYRTI